MHVIYVITDTIDKIQYVGSKRWYRTAKHESKYLGSPNCQSKRNKNYKLQQNWLAAIQSRPETFKFNVIAEFKTISRTELLRYEGLIQMYYNVVKSDKFINAAIANVSYGMYGDTMSSLTDDEKKARKKKISEGLRKTFDAMPEDERRRKFTKYGKNNGMYGKHHSEKTKARIRLKNIGSTPPNKGLTNVELFGQEKAKDISTKLSISARNRTGEKNSFYGKHHTKETRQAISIANTGRIPVNASKISIDSQLYNSIREASRKLHIKHTTIWYRLQSVNPKFNTYIKLT